MMKKKTLYILPVIFIIMITISPLLRLLRMNLIEIPLKNEQHYITFAILAVYTIVCILQFKGLSFKNISVNTFCFLILITLTTAVNLSEYTDMTIASNTIKATFWGVSLISFYFIGFKYENILRKNTFISIVIPFFYILVLGSLDYRDNTEYSVGTSAYYLACFLPFAFLSKNKIWKWFCFALTVMAILASAKRTGFIMIMLIIFVYIFVSNKIKGKKNLTLIKTTVALIIAYFIIAYLVERFNFSVLDRLLLIGEDGGSGRIEIYKEVIALIKQAPLIKNLFGHGFNQVVYNTSRHLSAHNDLLEVIYDYGFAGMIFYINMFVILFRYGKNLIDEKSEYVPAFYVAVAVLIPLSLTSHLIIYDTYFINLCAFFGLVMGNYDRNIKEIKNNQIKNHYIRK